MAWLIRISHVVISTRLVQSAFLVGWRHVEVVIDINEIHRLNYLGDFPAQIIICAL